MNNEVNSNELLSLCKRRGFIWPSFEIYGGVAGMFDYGPLGSNMRNNIVEVWRDIYRGREGFIEIDSETVNPREVFKASGHVDEFSDLITYCTKCQSAFRADHLVKEFFDNPDVLSPKELDDAFVKHDIKCLECKGKLGPVEEFNLMFKTTIGPGSSRVGYLRPETAQGIFVNYLNLYRYNREKLPLGVIQTGRGYRNEIAPRQGMIRMREFNMMEVELFVDPTDKGWSRFPEIENDMITLVPNTGTETVTMTVGEAVEKGIIANKVLAYFVYTTQQFLIRLGIDAKRLRFRQHLKNEMAHYAADCWDAEVLLSFGWIEITGIADRGCWDLSRHAEFSGTELTHFKKFDEPKEMEVVRVKAKHKALGPRFKDKAKAIAEMMESKGPSDIKGGKLTLRVGGEDIILGDEFFEVVKVTEKVSGERVVPHVIEPSHGLDRIFYSVLEHSYAYDKKEDYTVLRLAPEVAPIKVGVFPLMEKDGLDDLAKQIYEKIHSPTMEAYYDGSGTIGKRYARMDEVGTPWCITVDYEALSGPSKGTVTIRDRDTTEQKRIPVRSVPNTLKALLSGKSFKDI
ncbi:glycine--tRNA ligase [Candidatus Methanoplasma termitum]|uniref:glycine--tRNA ligase n=1 Tax=Candidatus Methanoplasma termitum TaxID=1577791 RepID=A0A0A7LG83_9ARCH|nr:glycine--tRNA ligase [Candidatus Methanoplasma termitum]AIZ56506.1 glycine--tRNA ligase [Candidatus Methanoplasma termitum]MCL2333242.1 glycine--tRNA ligase [Candidatus Methanoplasma sp.]